MGSISPSKVDQAGRYTQGRRPVMRVRAVCCIQHSTEENWHRGNSSVYEHEDLT